MGHTPSKRDAKIGVRVSPHEMQLLSSAARTRSEPLSEYVRNSALQRAVTDRQVAELNELVASSTTRS